MKTATLCLLFSPSGEKISLGMKKRGFGAGKWNGYGGKVANGESVEEAALRELREECWVFADEDSLENCGEVSFYFAGELKMTVHLFAVYDYREEPQETEEMKPEWFDLDSLPYDKMWPADRIIFPLILEGKKIRGEIFYDASGERVERTSVEEF